ncbi:ABC transporter ATP-binding protein [Mycolicibacterium vaccae]|uniref:ABC transporter ATP-binding protein n=1 Tax=Mycolicibacterium vaccae TaxID=1810 RepID=UPI003CFA5F5B
MTVQVHSMHTTGLGVPQAAIEMANVSKHFRLESGDIVKSVNGVSFRVEPGEFICVIGPSGHGKSTLLNMIAGFIPPTDGTITVSGTPVTEPGPDRGVVFQRDTLFLWKTVAQNIEFGLVARGVPKSERKPIVSELLRIIGLEKFANAWPKQLSGGMRRRVAIAAVFANKPEVLLMDEPFVGIDYLRLAQLHEVLLDLWQEGEKRAVFMVTHDIDEALTLADRIFVIKHGTLALDMSVDLPRPRRTDDITGPEANVLRRQLLEEFSR